MPYEKDIKSVNADLFIWRPVVAKLVAIVIIGLCCRDLIDAHEVLDKEHIRDKEMKKMQVDAARAKVMAKNISTLLIKLAFKSNFRNVH